ncbi:predicted protein [Coccidioides posadasii str. Silveira]|uniref:Predicted protein n=2 Tax=Coccidioides posadasii TaxID=199306 RepID=E9CTM8_COCPS|nr:predicted protein [Coccidioides posadasii str. Silveira]KMM67241.1 hypothetical protein CPAG_03576 [Coccidioides posadasii RMSCC 3488]
MSHKRNSCLTALGAICVKPIQPDRAVCEEVQRERPLTSKPTTPGWIATHPLEPIRFVPHPLGKLCNLEISHLAAVDTCRLTTSSHPDPMRIFTVMFGLL